MSRSDEKRIVKGPLESDANSSSDSTSDAADQAAGKSAEQAVDLSEVSKISFSAFRALAEILPMHFLQKDLRGRIQYANQRYCRMARKPLAELIGKTSFDLFPADRARRYNEDDRKAIETGEVVHRLEEHPRRDGSLAHVEVLKGAIRDAQGEKIGLLVLLWDISERKEFEAAFDQERHLLDTLLENVPDNIYFKDRESRFLRISRSLANKFGLNDPSEAVGLTDADFFGDRQSQQRLDDEHALVEGDVEVVEKEELELWDDGRECWVLTTKLPLHANSDGIVGTFGISRDITARKLAEAELANERDRLRTIINNVPDLIFVKDRAGRFVNGNDALLKALNQKSIDELIGKTDFDFWPAESACNFVADDQIVMRSGKTLVNQEESTHDRDGNEVWLLTSKVPLRDEQGNVTGLVGIGRDITRDRRAKEQLSAAKEQADAASRAKSDFLANMSHEIRTPMNAIIGMTELLMDGDLNTTQHEYLHMIQDSGDALLTVINDILDFSKIEAGRLELDPTAFDLRETLGNTLKSMAMRAHAKSIELAFRVQKDVPQALLGDVGRFRQIIVNLIGNAIKFTDQGEVVVDVGVSKVTADHCTLLIKVRDTGIGIPQDVRKRIFQEFQQADTSTTRRYGGTGLGLAISSRLVELMHGRITVTSQRGRGSEFQFTIRLETCDASELPRMPVVVGGTRVLIVDDNRTNRLILTEMLGNWGMVPVEAESAASARTCLEESLVAGEPFQIILSDVNMPEVDGYKLVEEIRNHEDFAGIPVLMLTSGMRSEQIAQREKLRITACMMKPVKQSELFDAIVRALGVTEAEDTWHQETESLPSCRPLRILLAEDNIVNQRLTLGVLERDKHQVQVTDNGRTAVRMVAKGDFDLVLMDVQMPQLDGLDATREVRSMEATLREQGDDQHVTIIAMTANAMKGDREECLDAGMDDYLAKPVRIRDITEKLQKWFPHHFKKTTTDSAETVPTDRVEAEQKEATKDQTAATNRIPAEQQGHVDWGQAMENVGGNPALLKEVIEVFLKDAPGMVLRSAEAVRSRNPAGLKAAAHSLKGAMLFLHTQSPYQTAFALERMGSNGDLTQAAQSVKMLEREIGELIAELKVYLQH